MPLQTQYMDVKFSGTLDEKTDKRLVMQGNFTNLENVVFTKLGALEKRPGNDLLTSTIFNSGPFINNPRSIIGYDDQLTVLSEDRLYSLNNAETAWYDKGLISEPTLSENVITSTANDYNYLTSAQANGISVFLYCDFAVTSVYATVVDASGAILFNNYKLNTGGQGIYARIGVVGNTITAFYGRGTNFIARQLDTTNPTAWSAEVTLPALWSQDPFDVCSLSDRYAIAFSDNTNHIVVTTFANALTPITTHSTASLHPLSTISISVDEPNDSLWVAWGLRNGAFDLNCQQFDKLLTVLTGVTSIYASGSADDQVLRITCIPVNSGLDAMVCINAPLTAAPYVPGPLARYYVTGAGGGGGGGTVSLENLLSYNDLLLTSKMFQVGTHVYVGLRSLEESTFYLADVSTDKTKTGPFRPCAVYADYRASNREDYAASPFTVSAFLSDVMPVNSNEVVIPGFTNLGNALNVSAFTAVFNTPFMSAENNGALSLSGALVSAYDGNKVVELGMLVRPVITATATPHPAGTLTAGVYRYRAVYEWTDAKGQLYQSAPSDVYLCDITAFAPCAIQFTVTFNTFSLMQTQVGAVDGINVVIYRETPLNSTVYRRLAVTANDPTSRTFTVTDSDNSFNTNTTAAVIYTMSELPNQHPPTAKFMINHAGRVWLAGVDNPTQLWFSKEVTEGEPPGFNEAQTLNVDDGGEITGLASMDDKLIVFKKERLYVIYGSGPGLLGVGGDFAYQRVAADTGCISAQSIVTTRVGVMYRSAVGIFLLSRALEVSYLGAPVEETTDAYPDTANALNHPFEPWVLFILSSSGSNQSVVVLYDYFQNKWAKWFLNDGGSTAYIQSATLFNDKFTWITKGAIPYRESAQYLDNGRYVNMTLETDWLDFAGLTGFQRVRNIFFLGQALSPHTFEISLAQNYDDSTYTQTNAFDSSVLAWPSEQFAIKVVTQKTSSIRVKLRDLAPLSGVGTGQGLVFSGMGLEVGVKPGLFNNLPLAQGG